MVEEHEPGTQSLPEDQTPILTNFILSARGPNKTFAVFEDDGKSGYLYLYSSAEQTVLRFLHVYDHPQKLAISPQDINVAWSEDYAKCGVIIWGKMRGIIDLKSGQE